MKLLDLSTLRVFFRREMSQIVAGKFKFVELLFMHFADERTKNECF